ncbi:MAG: hypothetical protein CMH83_20975 [Nocardioides sp.]|nr:hypothetical protein [Nocardioides sp.]
MSRGRVVLAWGLVAALGAALGVGSALWILVGRGPTGGTRVGVWSIDLDVGGDQGGRYVRAVTATQGLLAMAQREAVYFVADADGEGRALDADCAYEIAGADFPAYWWSITAYDGSYLADNTDDRASVDATSVVRSDDGSWRARLARRDDSAANWISLDASASPNLLLRLYVPERSVLDDPASVPVPTIRRLSCEGDT